ncbi:N-acetylmuramoyl-L-alanine amidase [Mycobacteroides abscessus subsp. abscessus]|nr:N-acetylmuramoyl-L-alanine amidase [Mycobacteroides abscessus subsp. abscessus]QSN33899.1 N-acetylmuramoyl-L-alanine amidase [Mycobacteroides abscessus subsp. abscessus]
MGYTGDPVWLEDVLRAALGDRLVVEAGWKDRGTGGQMGDIWGVMIHHTGNDRETVAGIRDGRSDLAGPLSQCLITPDGKCYLIAVGPCNHAGIGKYPGIAANTGNQRLIGFECAWPTIQPDGSFDKGQRWPDAQIITMRDATAAVLTKLGYGADRVIGHKEYATAAPNVKWDPGNIDMGWFRGEVAKDIAGYQFPGEAPVVQPPDPSPTAIPADFDKQTFQQINGRWEMLGWQTLIEAVAEIRDHITGSTDAGKTGFKLGAKP